MSTKLSKPKYPPIDWLMAAILERKKVMKLEWADLADVANISAESMRGLASKKTPMEWPGEIRTAVCRKLGISAKLVIDGLEHGIEL